MNKNIRQKLIIAAALMIAATASAFAQGNGLAGINEATSMVSSYFDPGTKLIYAIGAVVGLIGGVKVYGKFSSGDPDTSKTAASWFGASSFGIRSPPSQIHWQYQQQVRPLLPYILCPVCLLSHI